MVFLPGRIRTPLTVEAYEARMVDTFREEKAGRKVTCTLCPAVLATGSLRSHLATQHDAHPCFIVKDLHRGPLLPPARYDAVLSVEDGKWRCPVPNCPQGREGHGCSNTSNLRWHFAYRHPSDTVAVRGTAFSKCQLCGLQVSPTVLGTPKHKTSKNYRRMAAMRHKHTIAEAGARALDHRFTAYGDELRRVDFFKYLGRLLAYNDCDSRVIHYNLRRARGVWGRISKVIAKESVPPTVAGMFYQAVVASVLLYGSKTWVVPPHDARALEGFNVECCRRITGMRPRKRGEKWVYTASVAVLKAIGVRTVEHYIRRRRHTIHQKIIDRPILKECRRSERRRGSPPHLSWWEQDMELDLDKKEEEVDDESGSDMDISESETEAEGVSIPPLNQRDPRERYMEQPDGR